MSRSLIAKDALRPFDLKLDQLNSDSIEGARAEISQGAEDIKDSGISKLPRKTGYAASKVFTQNEDPFGNSVAIVSQSVQAYWLEWGTRKHEIHPQPTKGKKALTVFGKVFRRVQHPGIKRRHWLLKSYKEIAPQVFERLGLMLNASIKKKNNL